MPVYTLVIGSKNKSSWSLRPWLLLRQSGIAFDEVVIPLDRPETRSSIPKHSPTGKVPVLKADGLAIWDSLAIAEFIAESHPDRGLWPADRDARAVGRSVSAEMHAGFQALRQSLPMDFARSLPMMTIPADAAADIRRIVALWHHCRTRFGAGGPFLFGRFSVADAMFAPVASRFTTYAVDLAAHGDDGTAQNYRAMMMDLPAMLDWQAASRRELAA